MGYVVEYLREVLNVIIQRIELLEDVLNYKSLARMVVIG